MGDDEARIQDLILANNLFNNSQKLIRLLALSRLLSRNSLANLLQHSILQRKLRSGYRHPCCLCLVSLDIAILIPLPLA